MKKVLENLQDIYRTSQAVDALKNITRYISPNLALIKMHLEDFDIIRNTETVQNLLHQMELAEVTLENQK